MQSTKLTISNEKQRVDLPSTATLYPSGSTISGATQGQPLVYHADLDKLALGDFPRMDDSNFAKLDRYNSFASGATFDGVVQAQSFVGNGSRLTGIPQVKFLGNSLLAPPFSIRRGDYVVFNRVFYYRSGPDASFVLPVTVATDTANWVQASLYPEQDLSSNSGSAVPSVAAVAAADQGLQTQITIEKNRMDMLVANAPQALDTLKEISNQLTQDEQGAAAMLATQQQHTQLLTNTVNLTGDQIVAGGKTFTTGIQVKNTVNTTYNPVGIFFAPNNQPGTNAQLVFGVAGGNSNAAEWRFYYDGFGSSNNRTDFGYSGVISPVFSYLANGNTGFGTTAPTQRVDVAGNVKATQFIGDGSQLTNLPLPTLEADLSSNSRTKIPSVFAVYNALINVPRTKGAWKGSTYYNQYDMVTYSGDLYYAGSNFQEATTFTATKWVSLSSTFMHVTGNETVTGIKTINDVIINTKGVTLSKPGTRVGLLSLGNSSVVFLAANDDGRLTANGGTVATLDDLAALSGSTSGTTITVVQELSGNSTTAVPSVAAVKAAVGSASPAFEVRHTGGTINLVPYNPATNSADLLAVLMSAQNADASILAHAQATYSLSGVTYYPTDFYGFGSTLDIPAGSDNPVTLTGNHTLRNLTIRGNDEGPYFTAQSATTLTFRNCVFKPEDGIEYMGFTTEGNITVYFIDCDLSHCYPQTTDAVGKHYLQGNTSIVPNLLMDGTTLIDQRPATFFGSQLSNFPTKGDTAKLYVASRTNKVYRWTGTAYSELAAPSVVQVTGTSSTAVMSQYATTTALGLMKIGNVTSNSLATPDSSGVFLTMTSSNSLEFTIYVEANMGTVIGNHYYIRQGGSGRINITPRQVNGLSYPAPTLTCIGCDAYTTGVNSILHLIKVGPGDNWILTPLF